MQESGPKNRARRALSSKVTEALSVLLENKFLYQSVTVDTNSCSHPGLAKREFRQIVDALAKTSFLLSSSTAGLEDYPFFIELPQIVHTPCSFCETENAPHKPFNQVFRPIDVRFEGNAIASMPNDQTFAIPYQCQNCQKGSLVLLVRRTGLKLQLVGRSQIPIVPLPSHFPKKQIKIFRDALMANRTDCDLAGICLLRVGIEQFMREETCFKDRCSGDQLWVRLKERLDQNFPLGSVLSLGTIYEELSKTMHFPPSDKDSLKSVFEQAWDGIDGFFRTFALMQHLSKRKTTAK